jgi:thioredoxin-dependent peroxiredoxin
LIFVKLLKEILTQLNDIIMSLRLGDIAPDFTAETTQGKINFHEWLGDSWGMLFSHPADFTPVCTTELGKTALLKGEFEKKNVKVIAVSVDDLTSHNKWLPDIEEVTGAKMNFPIIADENRVVAELYDMIHPNASVKATVRSVFIIGPDKTVKLMLTYPASTGRNFNELLRVIDSLQLTAEYSVATPADWQDGDDAIVVPSISTEDAIKQFPKGVREVKPYLRYTPQPNK